MKNINYQISLKALSPNYILYTNFIKKILEKAKIEYKFFSLPIKNKKITLLKSPHVNKKAREQYEIKKYKSLIQIKEPKMDENVFKLILLNKPKYIKLNLRRII